MEIGEPVTEPEATGAKRQVSPAGKKRTAHSPEHASAFEYVWRSPWVRATCWSLLIAVTAVLLVVLFPKYSFVLTVGVVGFMLAYLLHPLVLLLKRIRIPRILAVIIVYLLLLGLMVVGSLLIGQIFVQMGDFANELPEVVAQASQTINRVTSWFGTIMSGAQGFMADLVGFESADQFSETVREQVAGMLATATTGLSSLLGNLFAEGGGILLGGATSIISGTALFIFILLASAYFLFDFERVTANFYRLVPVRWRPIYTDISGKADNAIGGYLRGQLLICLILGVLIWLGLTILGVPLALSIGFIAGIFNIVPYLGPILGAIPGVLLALTISPLTAVLVIGLFVLANLLESNLLQPIILGKVVNVHPLTVMLAIMAGVSFFGLVGALLAVPVVTFVKVMLEDYVLTTAAWHSGPGRFRSRRRLAGVADNPDAQGDSQ